MTNQYRQKIAARCLAGLLALALSAAVASASPKWIVSDANAFGCQTAKAVQQLNTMAILPSAFEIALAGKVETGECQKLNTGDVLELLTETKSGTLTIYQMRRAGSDAFYLNAIFVTRSI